MRRPAAVLSLLSMVLALAAPGSAIAQGGNPFGPLTPQTPPPAPEPAPAPQPQQQAPDDGELSARESLGLAAIAIILIAGVFVAILREGGRLGRGQRRRRQDRDRRAKATEPRKRGAAAFRSSAPVAAKAPPPPPRKRRAKARRK